MLAEDDGEGDGGEEGLDEVPEGAEDGLLVDGDEVSADEEEDEVAVFPEFAETQVEELALGPDDEVPLFL